MLTARGPRRRGCTTRAQAGWQGSAQPARACTRLEPTNECGGGGRSGSTGGSLALQPTPAHHATRARRHSPPAPAGEAVEGWHSRSSERWGSGQQGQAQAMLRTQGQRNKGQAVCRKEQSKRQSAQVCKAKKRKTRGACTGAGGAAGWCQARRRAQQCNSADSRAHTEKHEGWSRAQPAQPARAAGRWRQAQGGKGAPRIQYKQTGMKAPLKRGQSRGMVSGRGQQAAARMSNKVGPAA